MSAKYRIKLKCGHYRSSYFPVREPGSKFFCDRCNTTVERDIKIPAKLLQVGVTSN